MGAVIVALLTVLSVVAQGPSKTVLIRQVDTTNYPIVSAILEVFDERGLPIQNLAAEDLEVLEDGMAADAVLLTSTVGAEVPIGVVIAVDVSGSMGGEPLEKAKEAARAFLDQLAPQDQVSVVAFSSGVDVMLGFTSVKEAAKPLLDSLVAGGDTKLFDALYSSVEVALTSDLRYTMVVLLTDGEDTQSSRTIDEGIALASERGIPVFTIGLGGVDRAQLDRISEGTGGTSLYAPSADALTQAYQSVAQRLRGFYLLSYVSPQQTGAPQRVLQVKVRQGSGEFIGHTTFELNLPPLSARLENLEAGEDLEQERVLRLKVDKPEWVAQAIFTVDQAVVANLSKPPFETHLIPSQFNAGQHEVEVRIRDIIQREISLKGWFRIASSPISSPSPPPAGSPPLWRTILRWLSNHYLLPLGVLALVLAAIGMTRQIVMRRRGIRCPSCRRWYHRQGGCPRCSAHPKAQPKLIGQILIQSGMVTADQLDAALLQQEGVRRMIGELILEDRISEHQQERMRKWLGEMIVERGLVSKVDLRTALQLQAKHNAFVSRLRRLFKERELTQFSKVSFMLYMLFYGAGALAGALLLYLYYLSTA